MILVVGEILMDIFKDSRRIGGAPFNFAFHLKKTGLPVRFISRVGEDAFGHEILKRLSQHGFPAADIQMDRNHPTGSVLVDLDGNGLPTFEIQDDAAYDHLDLDSLTDLDREGVGMISFGTLIQRTDHGFAQIRRLVSRKPAHSTCFCDINMRPPHVNFKAVEKCLDSCDILKVNDDERRVLQARIHGPAQRDAYVRWLMADFGIQTVALTLGAQGSLLYQHGRVFRNKPSANTVVVDTVGAGDAYSAVLALGCLKGLAPEDTIELAAGFSSRICGIRGALPEDEKIYENLLRQMKGITHGR